MNAMGKDNEILRGDLVREDTEFTVEDLCHHCRLQVDRVVDFVNEGVLEARGSDPGDWRFNFKSIRRVRTVVRLQRDLGVNLSGAALALELLDRIAELEKR